MSFDFPAIDPTESSQILLDTRWDLEFQPTFHINLKLTFSTNISVSIKRKCSHLHLVGILTTSQVDRFIIIFS